MSAAELVMISEKGKQPERPRMSGRITKKWYTHAVEYYSALERKEILTRAERG